MSRSERTFASITTRFSVFRPVGEHPGELPLTIGDDAVIRPFSTIYAGNTIGDRFETGHCVMVREGNRIGNNVVLGTNAVLECNNVFGDNIVFHTLASASNSVIESNCVIGPNVVMLDDPHPRCPSYLLCKRGPRVREWARVGANSTLLPGVVIGRDALVGGGSTVTTDIPDHSVAAGNPAKLRGTVQELVCHAGLHGRPYEWLAGANLSTDPES